MTTITHRDTVAIPNALRLGSALMAFAGLAFIGYAVIFFVRNFTGSFLELGIGPEQVNVGRTEIRQFSPGPVRVHLAPAHRGLRIHRRHRARHRGPGLVRRAPR